MGRLMSSEGFNKFPPPEEPKEGPLPIEEEFLEADKKAFSQVKFTTLLLKVLDNIRSVLFTPRSKEQVELSGRIHVLKSNSAEVLLRLQTIRDQLSDQFDPRLSGLVSSVINPMVSKMQRIQEMLLRNENGTPESISVEKYNEWISNAAGWIEWYSKESERDTLIQFISQNIFSDGCKSVDKDVQFILDYQVLVLSDLLLDHQQKNDLRKRLDKVVFPHLVALQKLKEEPQDLDIESIAEWKDEIDALRSFHVNEAIHRIDAILESVSHFKAD